MRSLRAAALAAVVGVLLDAPTVVAASYAALKFPLGDRLQVLTHDVPF